MCHLLRLRELLLSILTSRRRSFKAISGGARMEIISKTQWRLQVVWLHVENVNLYSRKKLANPGETAPERDETTTSI
jgi:hypothetical protein